MMEMMVTIGTIRHVKLQKNHHHEQNNIQLFTDQMPFLAVCCSGNVLVLINAASARE